MPSKRDAGSGQYPVQLPKLTMDAAAEQHAHHIGKRLHFRTPLLFKGSVQNKNKYEKAQLHSRIFSVIFQ